MASSNPVAQRIQELLDERRIAPGGRLPSERDLATELGISRPSLREGMRRLVDLGVVETRQGSGTFRAPLDIADLLDARERLEPYVAGLAASRRSDADLAALDELLIELRAAVADPAAFAAADARIHETITAAAGSLALRVMLAALADLMHLSRAQTVTRDGVRSDAVAALTRLVRAIHEQDVEEAEQAMRDHLRQVGTGLR